MLIQHYSDWSTLSQKGFVYRWMKVIFLDIGSAYHSFYIIEKLLYNLHIYWFEQVSFIGSNGHEKLKLQNSVMQGFDKLIEKGSSVPFKWCTWRIGAQPVETKTSYKKYFLNCG